MQILYVRQHCKGREPTAAVTDYYFGINIIN